VSISSPGFNISQAGISTFIGFLTGSGTGREIITVLGGGKLWSARLLIGFNPLGKGWLQKHGKMPNIIHPLFS